MHDFNTPLTITYSIPGTNSIFVDPYYFRPTEVDSLLGDASKAKEKLGWEPKTSLKEMVYEMMESDINIAKRDSLIKKHGYKTVVMGASFRNTGEIESLAGCDRLTISPQLLQALSEDEGSLPRQLFPGSANGEDKVDQSESGFRWQMNEDAMATEKLAEGIRNFTGDQIVLEELLSN